jgi:putative transcription antitermination factor YqgF
LNRTVEIVDGSLNGQKIVALDDSMSTKVNLPKMRLNPAVSIIQISSGCLSECSFCQTKLAKGTLTSYRIGDILRQVKDDVASNCKEIWLTSTDNGCYGLDLKTDLVDLLEKCSNIEGDYKIRVGMMNPMYVPRFLDRLISLYRNRFHFVEFYDRLISNIQNWPDDHIQNANFLYGIIPSLIPPKTDYPIIAQEGDIRVDLPVWFGDPLFHKRIAIIGLEPRNTSDHLNVERNNRYVFATPFAMERPKGKYQSAFSEILSKPDCFVYFSDVVKEYEVGTIVLGYPKHLNNTVGERAVKSEEFADKLRQRTGIEVILWDERLTTVAAHQVLSQTKLNYVEKAKVVDKLAAVLILQGYLDRLSFQKNEEQ